MSGFDFFLTFYMNESFNLGSWLGRRQAFSALGGQGLFGETTCLRHIRDGRLYRAVSANWSDFCDQHLGVSRAHVDRLIQYREEFGETYFHLSQLIRISPETYRAILPHITEQGLQFKGEIIPIGFDQIPQLIAAVNAIRPPKKSVDPPATTFDTFENIVRQLRDCAARLHTCPKLTTIQRDQLAAALALFRDAL